MQMISATPDPSSNARNSTFRLDIHPDVLDQEISRRASVGLISMNPSRTSVRFQSPVLSQESKGGEEMEDFDAERRLTAYTKQNAKRRVSIAFGNDVDVMLTDQNECPNKSNFYSKTRSISNFDRK